MSSSETPPDPLIGQTIDRKFKILDRLGGADLGAVYRAEHIISNRLLALKVLFPPSAKDALDVEFLKNFQQLAKQLVAIRDPNTVPVEDFGIFNSQGYLVMPYHPGKTLTTVLAEEPLQPIDRLLGIILQVCSAVRTFHQHGIIHGDLKPDNIMLSQGENMTDLVQVLNFGVSAMLSGGSDTAMSQTGRILGSPEYMSPEQVQGKEVSERTDVYSLGIILYQMIAGEVPFQDEEVMDLLMKHVTEPPIPVRDYVPERDIPERLESTVMKAIEKEPTDRQQDVQELIEELSLIMNEGLDFGDEEGSETVAFDSDSFSSDTDAELLRETASLEAESAAPRRILLPLVTFLVLFAVCGTAGYLLLPILTGEEVIQPTPTPAPEEDPGIPLDDQGFPIMAETGETPSAEAVPVIEPIDVASEIAEVEPGAAATDPDQIPDELAALLRETPEVETPEPVLPTQEPVAVQETPMAVEPIAPPPIETPVEVALVEKPVVETDQLAPGFYVQIAAKEEKAAADFFVGHLEALNLPVAVQGATVGGVYYHRVVVGPYSDLQQAKAIKARIIKNDWVEKGTFIRKVK